MWLQHLIINTHHTKIVKQQWIIHGEEDQGLPLTETIWRVRRNNQFCVCNFCLNVFNCIWRPIYCKCLKGHRKKASVPEWLRKGATAAAYDLCPLHHVLICTVEELTRHAAERVIKPLTPGFMMMGGWGLWGSLYSFCSLKVCECQYLEVVEVIEVSNI